MRGNQRVKDRVVLWTKGSVTLIIFHRWIGRGLFGLHGMKEWPFLLLMLGLIIMTLAVLSESRKVMLCTSLGYMGGFAAGALFGADGVDPGGGATNNGWIIWTVVYLGAILSGVLWELKTRK